MQDQITKQLEGVNKRIETILTKWDQNSAENLIEMVETNQLPDAKLDSIELTNLLEEKKQLEDMIKIK
ncbi:MAG: hypothetical protein ACFFDT_01775 [Candidatus Hodarchaeota archaeon]